MSRSQDLGSAVVRSSDIESWVAPLVEHLVSAAEFNDRDFGGGEGEHNDVSAADIVVAMRYFAFKNGVAGGDTHRDDECYQDFRTRRKVFEKRLEKVNTYATYRGQAKIREIEKQMLEKLVGAGVVERKGQTQKGDASGTGTLLGAFVGVPEMESLFGLENPLELIEKLQSLGDHPESDPRYYVHMIFRYYLSDLHECLASENKVMARPSLGTILDARIPVSSRTNLPPAFRSHMKETAGGPQRRTGSPPVPSKTIPKAVVFLYSYEDIPWVTTMRGKIHQIFSGWKDPAAGVFVDIYPECLIAGNSNNATVQKVLQRSHRMNEVKEFIDRVEDAIAEKMLRDAVAEFPEVAQLYTAYHCWHLTRSDQCRYSTAGSDLREEHSFFVRHPTRMVFQELFRKSESPCVCEDIYDALCISFETLGVFTDYCGADDEDQGRPPSLSYGNSDE